jgi:hypothetical protein
MAIKDARDHPSPVMPVKKDHNTIIVVRTDLEPNLSARTPPNNVRIV